MKDLHNHLLYNVDDGSKTIKESIEVLKKMQSIGYSDIVLTPHYLENKNYCSSKRSNQIKLNKLKKELLDENIDINLYLGNEVYAATSILDLLKNKKIATINNSKYLLIEFPLNSRINNDHLIIFELISNGIIPVIAHPERYSYYNECDYQKFIEEGALLQGNITSLYNEYGKKANKKLKYLIKNKMIYLLSSDTHSMSYLTNINEKRLRRKLLFITKNKQLVDDLINKNIERIIKNI